MHYKVPLKLHSGSRGRREEVDPDQEEGDESVFDDDDDVKTSPSVKVVVLIVCGVVLVIGVRRNSTAFIILRS